ncbi:MAG: hypothetical protein V3V28_09460 [Polaribacter sp.]|uniref:hypothetical protein n=1 Tax=Polaribacter sp. TaxID=1920175 RepID=UPI002F350BB9
MKKKKIILLFLLICLQSFGQSEENHLDQTKSTYIKLPLYKKIFNKKLTKKDSSNFKISNGDTLVFIKNLKKLIKKTSKNKDTSFVRRSMAYMPLRQYKKRYTKIITREDSLNFKFKDNDTLIFISNKEFYKSQKRVSIPYEPKDSTFLEIYKDVVFKKYNSTGNIRRGKKEFMRLWEKPIKIYFTPSLDKYYIKKIKKEVKKLSSIDSLKISYVKDITKSNYIISQIDEKNKYQYSKNLRKNKYINYYVNWKNGRIYDGKLEINLTRNNTIDKKENANILLQHFYQTLGRFFKTQKLPCSSMLSSCKSSKKELTKLDFEIIKYHYSYGICKYTSLQTFEENHKKAKEILKKGGKMNFTHTY